MGEGSLEVHLHVARAGHTRHRVRVTQGRGCRGREGSSDRTHGGGSRSEGRTPQLASVYTESWRLTDPFGCTPTPTQGPGGAFPSWGGVAGHRCREQRRGSLLDPASSALGTILVRTGGSQSKLRLGFHLCACGISGFTPATPTPATPWIPCSAPPPPTARLWQTSREACCDLGWFLRPRRQMALTGSCPRKYCSFKAPSGVRGDDRVALHNPPPPSLCSLGFSRIIKR